MSQRTNSSLRARLLAVGGAAVLAAGLAAGPAQAAPVDSAAAPVTGFHAFNNTGFSGTDRWFNGTPGVCYYVGAGWNDTINSARTESGRLVELWDHAGCSGGAIVIDRTGYGSIGNWVSAYRIR